MYLGVFLTLSPWFSLHGDLTSNFNFASSYDGVRFGNSLVGVISRFLELSILDMWIQ